jgi:chaperonin cofactor prefoldin
MNAGIEELEKSLDVEQKKINDYKREQQRLEEKLPIVKERIQDTEGRIQDIQASIFVLKNMAEG